MNNYEAAICHFLNQCNAPDRRLYLNGLKAAKIDITVSLIDNTTLFVRFPGGDDMKAWALIPESRRPPVEKTDHEAEQRVAYTNTPVVTIDVSGPVGVGKSDIGCALAGLLQSRGYLVECKDEDVTPDDDANGLDISPKPRIVFTETVGPQRAPKGAAAPRFVGMSPALGMPYGSPKTAPEILQRAIKHMEDRAAARDQGAERSMQRTVDAFNALTGATLSERDGWLFMVVLKMARAATTPNGIPNGIPDDYEDMSAYSGLAGEAAAR